MHRRGNKSKKVPNVRLRPAAADAMARARASPEPTSCWAEDSQIVGSDDTVMIGGSCPRPFRNVVVCATGVVDKPALFKLALELGATSVSAFTDRVTHLVAENHGGAKYQCALERKIPILLPSWITESHRIWQHGDDVDLAQSIASHRLPVFSGVTLCISGIPDIVQRTKINKALTAAGGTYVKNLERPIRVTHLLCSGEAETEKMRYAEKFNRAGEADPPIQLVWDEWFWDSLEYGGRFDEAAYHARLPRPEGRSTDAHPVPNSHPNAPSHAQTHVPSAFDEEEDEFAPIARVPAQTLQLWGSLLKARGYEVDRARGSVVLSPGKAREMVVRRDSASAGDFTAAEAQGAQVQQGAGAGAGGNGSLLSSFRRAQSNSMVVVPRDDPGAGPSRMPFGRSATTGNLGSGARSAAGPSRAKSLGQQRTMEAPHASADAPSTVFAGLRFLLRGETDTATVRDAIEKAGGAVVRGEDVDYIIVRLVSGSALYRTDPSLSARARYRTECWLEQCACMDRVCAPDEHASFVPLGVPLPVPGADRITLSFSGLEVSEACWVRRLLKALGITLAPAFSRHSTHLLCPSGVGPKSVRARQWGVPVVDMGWLAAMARTGAVPPVHAFLVAPAEGEDVPAPVPEVRNGKGKGKEKEREKVQEDKERVDDPMQMQDITNSYDSQESPLREREGGFFLPPPPPARDTELVFGQPDASLGPPATPTPPKKQLLRRNTTGTPSRSRSRPTTPLALVTHAVPAPVLTQSSTASSTSASASHGNSKGKGLVRRVTNPPGPVRRDTAAAASTRRNPTTSSSPARVPSSTSPSPMRRGVSVSPPKIPDHRTKALQESIVSLLGKRPATPEESDVFAGRPGKRGRPHRSKPQSRQPSDALPVHAPVEEEPRSVFGARSLSPDPDGDGEGLSLMSGADEQSLRVMYEDPGQRAELRRLASLIGEPMEGEGAETRKRPRRSMRRGVS